MEMSKIKSYLIENKSKIFIIFYVLEILFAVMQAGQDYGNNSYLYAFLFVLAMHYGFDLLTNLKYTAKQKIVRFIVGLIGGVVFWQFLKIIF